MQTKSWECLSIKINGLIHARALGSTRYKFFHEGSVKVSALCLAEAGLSISPRTKIRNTEIIAFIDSSSLIQNREIWLEEMGLGWLNMSNICRRGGTTKKTPLKLWLLPLFPLSDQFREAHQQLSPGAVAWDQTRREHSEFLASRKSCVFWAKEQALQTLVVVCRFHLIHVTEKHRDFAVLTICIVLNDLSRSQMHVVSPSQPASHKTLTSFCLHYKFKIYL